MGGALKSRELSGIEDIFPKARQHMAERGTGVILNISSCSGLKPISGLSYSASKGAMINMTQNIAYRFVGTKIRCNCICPGRVETPLQVASRARAKNAPKGQINMHAFGDTYVNRALPSLKTDGQAYAALFLASDYAQDITGVTIPVDGGSYMPQQA